VWSGRRASGLGLVDAVGGLNRALQLAKQAAGLALDERVRLLEVSRAKVGWLGVKGGGQLTCLCSCSTAWSCSPCIGAV